MGEHGNLTPLETWTDENEELLHEWFATARTYRWLHNRTSARYSHRSQTFSILISILSYFSGGSVLTATNLDNTGLKYVVGYVAVVSGILTNINGLISWKALADKHKTTSSNFSSYARSISSMLSMNKTQRDNAIEFINTKRKEMDLLIANAPNIPTSILKEYEARDKSEDDKKISDFLIIFYSCCCCNRKLRKMLLADIDDDNNSNESSEEKRVAIEQKRNTIEYVNTAYRKERKMASVSPLQVIVEERSGGGGGGKHKKPYKDIKTNKDIGPSTL